MDLFEARWTADLQIEIDIEIRSKMRVGIDQMPIFLPELLVEEEIPFPLGAAHGAHQVHHHIGAYILGIPHNVIGLLEMGLGCGDRKGDVDMAMYVMFGKYSLDSVRGISPERTKKAAALIKENGGSLLSGYAMLGKVDLMLIVDFPGIEQAMKASVGLTKLLGISFTTAPAMSIEDFDKVMA